MRAPSREAMEGLFRHPCIGRRQVRVDDGVEQERCLEVGPKRRWQRPDVPEGGGLAAPNRVGDLSCPIGGLATLGEPGGKLGRGDAGDARPLVDGHGVDAIARRHDGGTAARDRRRTDHVGADDGGAAPDERPPRHSLPAAGLDFTQEKAPRAGPQAVGREPPGSAALSRDGGRVPDHEATERRLEERPRPRLVSAHLAREELGGVGDVQAAVLAPQGPGHRRSFSRLGPGDAIAADPGSQLASEERRSLQLERRLELRRRLVTVRARGATGRRSARYRVPRPCASASRPSRGRRQGSSPGSGLAPRCRGSSDGCRFSAPSGTSSSDPGTICP